MSKYGIDMTKGPILKTILAFAVPFMISSVLQQFYTAVNLVVVSRWAGSEAMASVGATSALINLLLNLFIGMSVGVSVIASRRYGAHDDTGMHRVVHTSILLSIILGFIALGLGEVFCKPLLIWMDTPEGNVLNGAILYMRIIFLDTPATICYNFGSAILRSVGDSKRPLYVLFISGFIHVLLNLLFVIKFRMGVAGVALATLVSKYISAIVVALMLAKADGSYNLVIRKLKIYKNELISILKIGIPAGLQNTVLSLANTIIQSAVNGFGAHAIAGSAAAANVETFLFSIKNAFAQATVTAVGQNYGARNKKRMNKSFYTCILCIVICGLCMGAVIICFAQQILSIYITDSKEAMDFGKIRLIVTALPYFISGIMEIYTGYIRGLGYSSSATINYFVGICGFRILWVLFIFPLQKTFAMLYLCWPLSWILVTIINMVTLHFIKKKIVI